MLVNFKETPIREYLKDPGVHAPSSISIYLHGSCHVFAIALSKLTGLPIGMIVEPRYLRQSGCYVDGLVHAFCVKPDNHDYIFDAKGWRKYADLKDEYDLHDQCESSLTDWQGCEDFFNGEVPINQLFLEETMEFIRKNYTFDFPDDI